MRIINQTTETAPIDTIRPHPKNPRQGDLGAIHQSIDANGFYGAVVAQRSTGFILAGNHRWMAARQANAAEIPVTWVDVDDDHALRILLADNRTSDLGAYDDNALADLLKGLHESTGTLAGTGYDGDDLDELLADLGRDQAPEEAPEAQVDRADELREKWGTALGQLWQVGPHRILCGDSSAPAVLDRVIAGADVGCLLTDPPYGIGASRMTMGSGQSKKAKRDRLSNVQAWDSVAPPVAWLLDIAPSVCIWGGNYFRDLPVSNDWLVWHKKNDGLSFGEAELAWTNYGTRIRVLQHHWSGEEKRHITQKPLPVIAWCLALSPTAGAVLDPFAGSGTTLVAAHKAGRTGYGIELDPAYVAVTLQRLADMGLTPELTH